MKLILLPRFPCRFKHQHRLILIAILCCLICQCSVTDPNFNTFSSSVEINPPKNVILGMWYREVVDGGDKFTRSLLFQSDGHGFHRAFAKTNMLLIDIKDDAGASFTWNYNGGGVWNISYEKYKTMATCRIAGNHLLYEEGQGGSVSRLVFSRVE